MSFDRVSIIIPCFNEESTLETLVDRILDADTCGLELEVVIVDDGNPIALLEPIDEGSNVRRGIREGWIRPPMRTGLADGERYPSTMTTEEALDEDRG